MIFVLGLLLFASTAVNLQVGASSDDGYEDSTGDVNIVSTVFIRDYNTSRISGARFNNVTVPQGATIDSAFFSVVFYYNGRVFDSSVYAEDVDNSSTFSTTSQNISSRPRTTASVAWSIASTSDGGNFTKSPDLATVIQEVVSRAGWSSGNSLSLLFVANTAQTDVSGVSYDGSTTGAAKLDIYYTESTGVQRRAIIIR